MYHDSALPPFLDDKLSHTPESSCPRAVGLIDPCMERHRTDGADHRSPLHKCITPTRLCHKSRMYNWRELQIDFHQPICIHARTHQ